MVKAVPGILLKRSFQAVVGLPNYSISYNLYAVDSIGKTWDFITNPLIQKVIENNNLKDIKVGEVMLNVDPVRKSVVFYTYVPRGVESTRTFRLFKKIGMAALVELQILRQLKHELKGYSLSHLRLTDERKRQLEKRGMRIPSPSLSIEQEYELCKKQVLQQYSKAKIVKRKKSNWLPFPRIFKRKKKR